MSGGGGGGDNPYPYRVDLAFDNETGSAAAVTDHRTQFRHMYERLDSLGRLTTALLQRCADEDDAFDDLIDAAEDADESFYDSPTTFMSDERELRRVKQLFEAWRDEFVTHPEQMHEVRQYTLDKAQFGVDEHGHPKKLRGTLGLHCFFELTRLHTLMHRPAILQELDTLACAPAVTPEMEDTYHTLLSLERGTKHPMWIAIVNTFDVSEFYTEKDAERDEEVEELQLKIKQMWERPIMRYTLSECVAIILFLTQLLNSVPATAAVVAEYRRVFQVVWLRCGALMQELHGAHIMDDEDMCTIRDAQQQLYSVNREFGVFCSIYLGEILRRLYYYDLLAVHNATTPAALQLDAARLEMLSTQTRAWVERIVQLLPEEAFDDLYQTHGVGPGYDFPGDDTWFRYRWPNKVHSRGACIAELRPHLHKRFYSEAQVNKHVVVASASSNYVSRLFIFKAIDEHLGIYYPSVSWLNGVTVDADGIEMSAYRLQTNLVPVVLQVFSSHWCYDRGLVYTTDNVYETIGVWFWLLQTRYQSNIYAVNISEVVRHVVGRVTPVEDDDELVLEPLEPPTTTTTTTAASTASTSPRTIMAQLQL